MWYSSESDRVVFSLGFRRGCVIGPLLYVAFINPLTGATPDLTCHKYPDLARRAFSGGLDREEGLQVRLRAAGVATSVPGVRFVDDACILPAPWRVTPQTIVLRRLAVLIPVTDPY